MQIGDGGGQNNMILVQETFFKDSLLFFWVASSWLVVMSPTAMCPNGITQPVGIVALCFYENKTSSWVVFFLISCFSLFCFMRNFQPERSAGAVFVGLQKLEKFSWNAFQVIRPMNEWERLLWSRRVDDASEFPTGHRWPHSTSSFTDWQPWEWLILKPLPVSLQLCN